MSDGPQGAIPYDVIAALRAILGEVADEVTREILRDGAEWDQPWEEGYARRVRVGVERLLRDFSDRDFVGWCSPASSDAIFAELGRAEARAGRGLDPLQLAMHRALRVIWRRLSERLIENGASRETLSLAGAGLLHHLDRNAEAVSAGYHEVLVRPAGQSERARRRLFGRLTSRAPIAPDALAALAATARWSLPRTVASIVVEAGGRKAAFRLLPPDILIGPYRELTGLIVADPDQPRRRRLLELALGGLPAAVGPTVPPASAGKSLRWANRALELAQRKVIVTDGLIRCGEHMSVLMLLQDEELAESLVTSRLAPLADLRPIQRERLAETTLAWIQAANNIGEVANRLRVHPQTVRYRLRQVNDLFGDRLHDPDARFELEIALRARHAVG